MAAEFLFLLALLWIVYLVVTTWPVARRVRRLRRIVRTERARSYWAEARDQLMCLARDGKIDIRSNTFLYFYTLQTFVIRRPDAYAEVAQRIVDSIKAGPRGEIPEDWAAEVRAWPEEMKGVVEQMGKGVAILMLGFLARKSLIPLGFKVTGWLAVHASKRAYARSIAVARRVPVLRQKSDLLAAIVELNALSAAV